MFSRFYSAKDICKNGIFLLLALLSIACSTKSKSKGFVTVDVIDGYGDVYIDGVKIKGSSLTPVVKKELTPGWHKIIIKKDGFQTKEKAVNIGEDEINYLFVEKESISTPIKDVPPKKESRLLLEIKPPPPPEPPKIPKPSPPTILITDPKEEKRQTNNENIVLCFVVVDVAGLVENPEITLGHEEGTRGIKIFSAIKKKTTDLKDSHMFEIEVPLKVGGNNIGIKVVSRSGLEASKEIRIHRLDENGILYSEILAGKYYALIIGNNQYRKLSNLTTAEKDVLEIQNVLQQKYGFETKLLLNATREEILSALSDYRKALRENDNLLIYYAGHGYFDRITGKAYWLPVDALEDEDTKWIMSESITSNIKRFSSKHILIIADSCFSGTFTRNPSVDLSSNKHIKKMFKKPSRTLMASGGNEPVSDIGGAGHSVFADSLIKALNNMKSKAFTAESLFYGHIKERVSGRSDQTPEYSRIRNSGHEGGDFVFIQSH